MATAEPATLGPATARRAVLRIEGRRADWVMDEVATELPLTLRVNGVEVATLVATPADLEDLVYGFLVSERVVPSAETVRAIAFDPAGPSADVTADAEVEDAGARMFQRRYVTSCCGKGRASIYFESDASALQPVSEGRPLRARTALELIRDLQERSDLFRRTGGVHNVALATPEGEVLAVRADIGRHNALDKLYGHCLRNALPTSDLLAVLSGRISSEILLKAAKLRLPIVLSKSAPTELALALADEIGITVVGFARQDRLNVYTYPGRVLVEEG